MIPASDKELAKESRRKDNDSFTHTQVFERNFLFTTLASWADSVDEGGEGN